MTLTNQTKRKASDRPAQYSAPPECKTASAHTRPAQAEADKDEPGAHSFPYTCAHCGRGLNNAGSKGNHERACLKGTKYAIRESSSRPTRNKKLTVERATKSKARNSSNLQEQDLAAPASVDVPSGRVRNSNDPQKHVLAVVKVADKPAKQSRRAPPGIRMTVQFPRKITHLDSMPWDRVDGESKLSMRWDQHGCTPIP